MGEIISEWWATSFRNRGRLHSGIRTEEGLEAVRKVAKKSPEAFVAIAARICPNDVRLTLEQTILE